MESDSDEWPRRRVKNLVRLDGPEQLVADEISRCMDGRNLRVFTVRIDDLKISGSQNMLDLGKLQSLLTHQVVHLLHQIGQLSFHNEVLTMFFESLHRTRSPGTR